MKTEKITRYLFYYLDYVVIKSKAKRDANWEEIKKPKRSSAMSRDRLQITGRK
jgi:hypothetical protein